MASDGSSDNPKSNGPKAKLASLSDYDKKRDFARTPEPGPEALALPSASPRFMVHKHHARRLHYDLRLEIDGALGSWAVPRGPSYDPETKRLAVQTEDHPLAYGDFEGRIPDGLYGAGESLIWDRGHFDTVPPGQVAAMRRKGHIHFRLDGEKLHGEWHLLRTTAADGRRARQGDASASGPKSQWLLVKVPDAVANPALDIVAARPESVLTGQVDTRGPAPAFRGSGSAARGEAGAAKPSMPKLLATGVLGSEGRLHANHLHANRSGLTASERPAHRQPLPLFAAIDLNTIDIDVSRPRALLELPSRLFASSDAKMEVAGETGVEGVSETSATAEPAELLFLLAQSSSKSRSPALGAVADVALVLRDLFLALGLHSLPSSCGPRALLIRVAISPTPEIAEMRRFAARVAETLAAQVPAIRDGKVTIDLSLNEEGAARPALLEKMPDQPKTLCTPLSWDEVTSDFSPSSRNARWLTAHKADALAAIETYRRLAAPLPRAK